VLIFITIYPRTCLADDRIAGVRAQAEMYPCICTNDRLVCLAVHPDPQTHTHKHGCISNGNFPHNSSRYISPRPQNPRHEPGCKVFMIGCEHFLSIYPRSPLVPPNSPGRELGPSFAAIIFTIHLDTCPPGHRIAGVHPLEELY